MQHRQLNNSHKPLQVLLQVLVAPLHHHLPLVKLPPVLRRLHLHLLQAHPQALVDIVLSPLRLACDLIGSIFRAVYLARILAWSSID